MADHRAPGTSRWLRVTMQRFQPERPTAPICKGRGSCDRSSRKAEIARVCAHRHRWLLHRQSSSAKCAAWKTMHRASRQSSAPAPRPARCWKTERAMCSDASAVSGAGSSTAYGAWLRPLGGLTSTSARAAPGLPPQKTRECPCTAHLRPARAVQAARPHSGTGHHRPAPGRGPPPRSPETAPAHSLARPATTATPAPTTSTQRQHAALTQGFLQQGVKKTVVFTRQIVRDSLGDWRHCLATNAPARAATGHRCCAQETFVPAHRLLRGTPNRCNTAAARPAAPTATMP